MNDQGLAATSQHNQSFYPITGSPAQPSQQKSAACISSRYHFKLSQALLQAFDESNGKVLHRRRSYGTPREYYPHDIVYSMWFFVLSHIRLASVEPG